MTKIEIAKSAFGHYISSCSPKTRYSILFGSQKSEIETGLNVTIEERHYAALASIPDSHFYISVTDPFKNISLIAVLIPNT